VISQIGLAVPLIGLYEISILAAKLIEKGRARRAAVEEAEGEAGTGSPEKA
jgi:sec-independent protein translocase protein TatC